VIQPQQAIVPTQRYVEFMTKLSDGLAILTNNCNGLTSFKAVADKDALYAPRMRDIKSLYRLHLCRERRLSRASVPRCMPSEGRELDFLAEGMAFDIERQARVGYLYRVGDTERYRMTIRGAYLMTWGELPIIKQIRKWRSRQRALREEQMALAEPTTSPR